MRRLTLLVTVWLAAWWATAFTGCRPGTPAVDSATGGNGTAAERAAPLTADRRPDEHVQAYGPSPAQPGTRPPGPSARPSQESAVATGSESAAGDTAAVDAPPIEEQIRTAAGPMADLVNSSLAENNLQAFRKEHTLLIMALKTETRRSYFLTWFMSVMDAQQLQLATDIIDSYAPQYQQLLDRRAQILEHATDGDSTERLLQLNGLAAVKLSRSIRQRLIRDILTAEQKKQYAAQFQQQPKTTPLESGDPPH